MLYSAQHKVMVYDTPDAARVMSIIPDARPLNGHAVIVPHTMHNMQLMRYIGFPAYSPILTSYDWPRNPFKVPQPFSHQLQMAAFMTLHPRCFNLSEMRTGKTLATLWAVDYLMRLGFIRKCLIMSPLSTIYRVWENEIKNNFIGLRSHRVLYGSRSDRLDAFHSEADFYIINHDGLGVGSNKSNRGMQLGELAGLIRESRSVDGNSGIDCVVIDEGSVYKDSATNRYKVLKQVLAEKPYVYWLTGTPTPVEPTNAWAQARIVRKDYTESFKNLQDRTMMRISQFKWVPKREGAAIAAQVLQPAIRFTRAECFGKESPQMETYDVELSPAQKKAYDQLKQELRTQVGQGIINAINEATLRTKLLQVVCGAVYGPDHDVHRIDCEPRLAALEDIISEAASKIIVFAPLTSVVNLLYHELSKHYTVERITGNVSAGKRNTIFQAFCETANPRILVADPGCMAHGLDLSAADTIVWFGPTDKPEIYQQANARIEGPKQVNQMLIVRLAATSIEREAYRRLDAREKMQGLVLTLIKDGLV
jgi:hypothetical protein